MTYFLHFFLTNPGILVVAKNVRSCKGSWGLRGKAAAIERRGNRPGNKPDKLAMH